MKNTIRIVAAVVLLLAGILLYGSNRPRALADCLPEGEWESVNCVFLTAEPQAEFDMTPEEVKTVMEAATVAPGGSFSGWSCSNIDLHIRIGGETWIVEAGEDGNIVVQEVTKNKKTYWCAPDDKLFLALTGQ